MARRNALQRGVALPLPLAGLCLLLALAACAFPARWGPYRGRVIEAETRAPIEGPVVVAVWHRAVYGGPGGPVQRFEDAAETLTNAQGEFEIPARVLGTLAPLTEMRGPHFTVFKPGYGGFPRHPKARAPFGIGERASRGDALVELPQLSSKEERRENLLTLDPDAPYDRIPHFVKTMNEERRAVYGQE